MKYTQHRVWGGAILAVVLAATLAACGGGSDGPLQLDPLAGSSMSDVPPSATSSAAGALAFVTQVSGSVSESDEPLVLGDAVLASSDTDEPADL